MAAGWRSRRLDDREVPPLVDLDDPVVLVARGWRPSQVATRHRATTQSMARTLFDGGAVGCSWWSALDASWTNVDAVREPRRPAGPRSRRRSR